MTQKLNNISSKLDPQQKEVLLLLQETAAKNNTNFLVVGATARDIILNFCYNVKVNLRATVDLDFGISVPDWETFHNIKNELIATGKFTTSRQEHRIIFKNNLPIDIVPFGGIEDGNGKITFPPDNRFVMTTLGFKEALSHAVEVTIQEKPQVIVFVAGLVSLFIMKLIAWDEKYPERNKDAADMAIIIKYYLEGDNSAKLAGEDADLIDVDDFDVETAAARVLGRDIKRCSNKDTIDYVLEILEKEKKSNRLAIELNRYFNRFGDEIDSTIHLVENILQGIMDIS